MLSWETAKFMVITTTSVLVATTEEPSSFKDLPPKPASFSDKNSQQCWQFFVSFGSMSVDYKK